jgi:two-component system sensor histidine kinase PilS (NtrC family)
VSTSAPGWFVESQPAEQAGEGSFGVDRLYRAFLAARAALGLALVSAQWVSRWLDSAQTPPTLGLSVAYALIALLTWLLPLFRPPRQPPSLARASSPQWWSSIGLDLLMFGALNALDTSGVNYGALFVMPVLMAGVLSPRLMAVATAAGATLALLLVAGWSILRGADVGLRMTQAGLVGAGLFVVALLASELAARLAREARAARGSLALARQQEELNRLVIDEMQEGVLVLDRRGRVRAANPAAHQLLGETEGLMHLHHRTALAPLVEAVDRAYDGGASTEAGSDVVLSLTPGTTRSLRLRLRFTRRREQDGGEELCVLFLEDNRALLARSRQEKLAAMGRVSAGIAHEIRNPLAAIAQANALLAEDLAGSRNEQLTQMVSSNVQRLKRLVDDVMEVAPGVDAPSQPLDAAQLVRDVVEDWVRINGLSQSARFVLLPLAGGTAVNFEPEHLRRVLVNLLDNALRHADSGAGAISVRIDELDEGLELVVYSDAPAIAPEIERHLFEPFFSTRSRGSGLGLYICRELCERHGARIEYRRRTEAPLGNEFCVLMRRFVR